MATTTSVVTHPVNNYYVKAALRTADPFLTYERFGQVVAVPENNTNVVKFRRFNALSAATTALTEGETPAGSNLSITDVTATILQYGDYVTLTDFLNMTALDPVAQRTAERLGKQMALTRDSLIRNTLAAGTAVKYAGSQSARGDLTASHVIATADLQVIIRTLKVNDAPTITSMVNPSDGYGTIPVDECYVGVVHPRTSHTLRGLTGFTKVEYYADPASRFPGEIGRFDLIRFIESTNAKVFTGEGSGSADVYATLIFGADAFGVTGIGARSFNLMSTSGGESDPLMQRYKYAWKMAMAGVILNNNFLYRYEHGVAA